MIKKCIELHVKYPLFLFDFNKNRFYQQIFEKYSNIICHENPVSGSPEVPCGRTDRQTDTMKLIRSYFSQFCERA